MLHSKTASGILCHKAHTDPAMTSDATYDVFLSHATQDKPRVKKLAQRLRAEGLRPFFDEWHLVPGETWQEALEEALNQSQTFAIFLGPRGLGPWQDIEMRHALAKRAHDRSRRVIPVLLPGASMPDKEDLPPFLAQLTWVDFRSGLKDRYAFHRLLCGIRGIEPEEGPAGIEPLQPPPAWPTKIGKALLSSLSKPFARIVPLLAILITLAGTRPEPPRPSVAVLTFENQSGEGDFDWLSTALTEAVNAKLGLAGDVRAVDRSEVALAEMDLLLNPHSEVSSWDLQKIRGLLGVEFVLRGLYERKGASSPIRLELILYDARDGRIVAKIEEQGPHWLDLADRSIRDLPGLSLRQKLKWPPRILSSNERLRGLFPGDPLAAQLYFQGLARYRSFDILGAADFFGRSAKIEPHPLVLARLADMNAFLGRSEEAQDAIQRAIREAEARKRSRALPERYRREMELIEREVASDSKGLAEKTYSFFQEFFPDDLSYGLIAAQTLIDAGSFDRVEPFLEELRLLPLAKNHPSVAILEADALFVQHHYRQARPIARLAIEQARALEAVRQEALARLQLASVLGSMGCRAEAVEQFQMARAAFDQTGDRIGAAQCLVQTALFYEGFNLSQAKNFYEQAIRRYDELGANREKQRALRGLNAVLLQAGQLPEAERASQEAASEDATAFLQDGARFYFEGDMANARAQVVEAKARLDKEKQPDDYAAALTNLGEIELMGGRLYVAEDLHVDALNVHEGLRSNATPYDLVCLGRVYMLTGDYTAARLRLDSALQWLKIDAETRCGPEGKGATSPDSVAWYEALLAMAELELLTGHTKRSEERVGEVLTWARREEFKPVRSRALSLQARRLHAVGRISAAEEKVNEAMELASGDFRADREAQIASALVRSARAPESAVKKLYEIANDSAQRKHVVYELESRLLAGKIELDQLGGGRDRLEELRDQAAKLHFGQIVQRAESALKNR